MKTKINCLIVLAVLGTVRGVYAEVLTFTDETAYLAEMAARGYTPLVEDFDGPDWDHVRYTIADPRSAPSVFSKGLTWSGNEPVATNTNWGRFGTFGIFTVFTPPISTAEEFFVDSDFPLFGVGGWIDSGNNTDVGIEINGQLLANRPISGAHLFLGVIDTCGFTSLRIYDIEMHSALGADDFTFAVGGVFTDCNSNGRLDSCDLMAGTSADCNANQLPDECDIAAGSANDCNTNALPDACELVTSQVYSSGQLSPIGAGFAQSFTVAAPPAAAADVILDFSAYANLSGTNRFIDVDINGTPVGTVFQTAGTNCPAPTADGDQLVVPQATFNNAVGGGDAVIGMTASPAVIALGECDLPTYVAVSVTLFIPSAGDANGNGVLDVCESPGDMDGDGDVDLADYALFADCLGGPGVSIPPPGCSAATFATADLDADNDVDARDFAAFQAFFVIP